MRLKKITYIEEDFELNMAQHAIVGQVINAARIGRYDEIYDPMLVIMSHFEKRFLDEFGDDTNELVNHGTNYVDAIRLYDGKKYRVQYYEYAIFASQTVQNAIIKEFLDTYENIEELCPAIKEIPGYPFNEEQAGE